MAKVQKDKKQHFGVCMIATLVAAVVNRLAGSSDNEAAVAGANLAIGLAVYYALLYIYYILLKGE